MPAVPEPKPDRQSASGGDLRLTLQTYIKDIVFTLGDITATTPTPREQQTTGPLSLDHSADQPTVGDV